MADIVAAEQLTKRYGRRVGVDRLELQVAEGEIFGFLGPNGAGKTTTIRLLLGLVRPSGGNARVLGRDCWRESHRIKQDVGYLPGDLRLYSWMTASRALRVFGRIRGRDMVHAGLELAERFSLEPDLPVHKMSRGMRQKLGLVLALAHRPRLFVLDEPTSGLDPLMQAELGRLLRELAQLGHTVFFSSHTLSEVEQLCDRVAIVRQGRIVADERLTALQQRASRLVTVSFTDAATAAAASPPDFLRNIHKEGACWKCEVTGSAQPLIRWAATHPIHDLEIGRPNLEHLFRSYYQADEVPS
jgi:ABC-2 type transport system ATP-binding protein